MCRVLPVLCEQQLKSIPAQKKKVAGNDMSREVNSIGYQVN